jgi:hypothetical protein
MSHAMQHPKSHSQIHFKIFDRYDFIKSFVSPTSDNKARIEEERKAEIIATAIQETQSNLLDHLVTKEYLHMEVKDLRKEFKMEMKNLEYRLIIQLTTIMAFLMTFLPVATGFIRHLLNL